MIIKPAGIIIEYHFPKATITGVYLLCLAPIDWNAEAKPCCKCNDKNTKATTYKTNVTIPVILELNT